MSSAESQEPKQALDIIIDDAWSCTRCPNMHGRTRVLSHHNGSEHARCLVLAEAPGQHGADKTGVPLHGDRSGDHFEQLLQESGISRDHLFISNAVLCSPQKASGAGRKPTRAEIAECSRFTGALIETIKPALVVTLGATALSALEVLEPHDKTLKDQAGVVFRWNRRFVLPLYHPGARAMIKRSWAQQRRDYALWASLIND